MQKSFLASLIAEAQNWQGPGNIRYSGYEIPSLLIKELDKKFLNGTPVRASLTHGIRFWSHDVSVDENFIITILDGDMFYYLTKNLPEWPTRIVKISPELQFLLQLAAKPAIWC